MKTRVFLRRLAVVLAAPAAASALLMAAFVLRPQWFLTAKTVGRGIQIFGRPFRPTWSRFDFAIRSPGALEKDVALSADDVCFEKADGSVAGCFKSLQARFTLRWTGAGVRVTKIALLDAQGGRMRVKEADAKGTSGSFRMPRLPSVLLGADIEKVSVGAPSIELSGSSATTHGALAVNFDAGRADPLTIDARWSERGRGNAVHLGRAHVSTASDFFKAGRPTFAAATGSFDAEGMSGRFSAKARRTGAEGVSLEVEASGRRDGRRFRFDGRGVQTPTAYRLEGSVGAEAPTDPLRSLRLEHFDFTASRKRGTALPESLRLEGELRAEPADFRPVRGFKPPRFVAGRVVLNARAAPTILQKDRFEADLSVVLNPYTSWYEARAQLFAKASGRIGELPALKIRQRVEADVTVARFKDLVDFLADGPYAVPAPLDALEGGLRATFTESGDPRDDRVEFRSTLRGDLSGQKQKLKFHVTADGAASRPAAAAPGIKVRIGATLDDVALQMPHLDPLKMPAVKLDSRIKNAGSKAKARAATARRRERALGSASNVAIELKVDTARPIVLYSDLAKTPVPVALNLTYENPSGRAAGTVEVHPFDVEFFRRKAVVDHLTLALRPDSKTIALDGLIKYKADEAMIDIRLLGTVDKPRVVFESDPPLAQSDIIAMLVFGKSPDELDADQIATVSNTQTAMSDEAFGLASLYLFASTPLQYVGYDPAAKSYTMKFRIPGGETLELNSDFDTTKSVQLRRRLSKHFAIVTEAVDSQTEGNGVITMLEWFARY